MKRVLRSSSLYYHIMSRLVLHWSWYRGGPNLVIPSENLLVFRSPYLWSFCLCLKANCFWNIVFCQICSRHCLLLISISKVRLWSKSVLVRVKMAMVSMNIMMVSMAVLGAVLYMQVITCMQLHTMDEKYSTPCLNWVKSENIFIIFCFQEIKTFQES